MFNLKDKSNNHETKSTHFHNEVQLFPRMKGTNVSAPFVSAYKLRYLKGTKGDPIHVLRSLRKEGKQRF